MSNTRVTHIHVIVHKEVTTKAFIPDGGSGRFGLYVLTCDFIFICVAAVGVMDCKRAVKEKLQCFQRPRVILNHDLVKEFVLGLLLTNQ